MERNHSKDRLKETKYFAANSCTFLSFFSVKDNLWTAKECSASLVCFLSQPKNLMPEFVSKQPKPAKVHQQ